MVDRTLFSLINKKIITEKDYEEDTFKLSKEAIKKIFYHFDNRINETIYHRQLKRNVSYRYLIRLELYKIINDINDEKEYKPFVIWW